MKSGIIVRVAVRNICRHIGKNMLLGVMVFLATMVFIFTGSIIQESKLAWRDFFGSTTTGYANVHVLKGMKSDMSSPSIEFPSRYVSDRVIGYLDKNRMQYAKRIRVGGLKYSFEQQKFENGDNTCDVIGSDFEREIKYLSNLRITDGKYDPVVENGVVIWKQFAGRYHLKIGDELSFFINDSQNNMMPYTFVVTGLFDNRSGHNMEVESNVSVSPVVFAKFDYIAKILGAEDGMCTEIAVWNRDQALLEGLRTTAAAETLQFSYADEIYNVVSGVIRFVAFLGKLIGIFILIVFTVATFNINIMSFMERRREIGTMIAIGAGPLWVARLLLTEMIGFGIISFTLSVIAYVLIGAAAGGVDFGEMGILFSNKPFTFTLVTSSAISTMMILISSLMISTVYPLYLAYRINPAEVFREGSI
jgi:ABC-type lipoprotein release transport system permease subunit